MAAFGAKTHINLQEIPDSSPLRYMPDEFVESLTDYALTRSRTAHMDVENTEIEDFDIHKMTAEAQDRFKKYSPEMVERKARDEDIEMMIELGLRKYTGCGATKNNAEAHDLWTKAQILATSKFKRSLAAIAACYNAAYFMNLHLDNHTQSTLQNAGFCADFAASRGLISPTTLLVASHLERLLQNLHMLEEWIRADFKAKASGYKALWAALERRNQALAERDRKRAAKVGRAPNAYACARNGCPIKATSKMALRRCTGPCPEEVKPAYCGVECQRLDWKTHKKYRKPHEGSTTSTLIVRAPEEEDDDENTNASSKTKKNRKKKMKRRQKKKELRMTLTGSGTMEGREIMSSTMDLDMMKEIHEHLAKMSLEREQSGDEVD